ncbi:hypothetical protein ACFVFD_34105 [Streptomyces fimicarius]
MNGSVNRPELLATGGPPITPRGPPVAVREESLQLAAHIARDIEPID